MEDNIPSRGLDGAENECIYSAVFLYDDVDLTYRMTDDDGHV